MGLNYTYTPLFQVYSKKNGENTSSRNEWIHVISDIFQHSMHLKCAMLFTSCKFEDHNFRSYSQCLLYYSYTWYIISPMYIHKHRPYSRQVIEQLPLSGSFHSHQLIYLKASNAASSENQWFFRSSFYCTLSLYNNIAVLLWAAPSMHV